MKSILNAHPFFPSLPPHQCPWMLMVSHHHLDALICMVFSLFLPFCLEKTLRTAHMYLPKNGMKYLFSAQTDSSPIIGQTHDHCLLKKL